MTERIITKEEAIKACKDYEWHFDSGHTIIEDKHGTYRYKADPLIVRLVKLKLIDMNEVASSLQKEDGITVEERMDLYRRYGVSLCMFDEVFIDGPAMEDTINEMIRNSDISFDVV